MAVQSMLNVPIADIAGNVAQARRLEAEGAARLCATTAALAGRRARGDGAEEKPFRCLWWRTFTSITRSRWPVRTRAWTRSASIPATSAPTKTCGPWLRIRIGVAENGGSLEKDILAK